MPPLTALRFAFEPILELLYPTRCAGCGAAGPVWCETCRARLVPLGRQVCLLCRREYSAELDHDGCGPEAPRAWAVAAYRPPLDRALTHLKYRPDTRLALALAQPMARLVERRRLVATCIVPVPLGRRRQRQRGYNQTEVLGRALSRLLGLPLLPSAVTRLRETRSQVGLEAAERWTNVQGAFAADPALVQNQTVLLIDDVHTTGSTLAACADALVLAGTRRVVGLTVGRA